ncbi:MAG: ABC transporter permease [Actinobacteria bacterium]|nr:ABC transporter permease [Actinomycetota bacterium]
MPEGEATPAPKGRRRPDREESPEESGVWYPRWFWPSFASPGIVWLLVLFVLPFYVILAIAFGTVDLFRNPLPVWQPWWWTKSYLLDVLTKIFGAQAFLRPTYYRTLVYVIIASAICLLIGYAVAYYVARHAGKRKTLILILLISPFWISYLMRMLAWVNLLESDGYVNRTLQFLHLIPANHPIAWLEGKPVTVILGLVYGYIPYMILPLYGFLDRIQSSLLEAGRDLGASPASTFWRVTLPLSKPAIYAGLVIVSLPMFGDYYTNNLLSGSPKTTMIGNLIDDSVGSYGQGPQGAVLVIILMILLLVPMLYYMRSTLRAQELK